MEEREELKQELEEELQVIEYRMKMLDIIDEKLLQMKKIAEQIENGNLSESEIEILNIKLKNLSSQVKAIDGESRIKEDGKILE